MTLPADPGVHAPAKRIVALDALRIAAAAGIVWFHTDEHMPARMLGYAGLPAFIAALFMLLPRVGAIADVQRYVRKRAQRLLVPWIFWYALYALLFGYFHRANLRGWLDDMLQDNIVLAGPTIHLWFLPYAFLASVIIVSWNALRFVELPRFPGVLPILVCASAVAVFAPAHAPYNQWLFALPATLLGTALRQTDTPATRGAVWGLTVLGCAAVALFSDRDNDAFAYFLGISALVLALQVKLESRAWIDRLSELTMGVYLVHIFTLVLAHKLMPGAAAPFRFLLALLGACAITWTARQTRLGRAVT